MILVDKLIMLRKQNAWSQEDLAEKMGVSRQSVSKWESATSMPDLDKILKLSQIFEVTTDYLLKEDESLDIEVNSLKRYSQESGEIVTLEKASDYMDLVYRVAGKIAFGVSLCVFSPVVLLVLLGFVEREEKFFDENIATGVGVGLLLFIVAGAVALFISQGLLLKKYEYLEKESFSLDYGVEGLVEQRKKEFEGIRIKNLVIGVVLCIIGAIPLVVISTVTENEVYIFWAAALLLLLISFAVYLFVWSGMIEGSYLKLLQEEDYSPKQKKAEKIIEDIAGIYWTITLALYLAVSFIGKRWDISWAIFPIAGTLFGTLAIVVKSIIGKKKE